jgi:hypothetical protein
MKGRSIMNVDTKLAEEVADLGNMAMDLAETMSNLLDEGEVEYLMVLDALAIHGYTIVKSKEQNIASIAYMYGLSLEAQDI